MKQFLTILARVFAQNSNSRNFKQIIVSRNPSSRQQLAGLLFGYQYQYAVIKRVKS